MKKMGRTIRDDTVRSNSLDVAAAMIRSAGEPLTILQIIERAERSGATFQTKSNTPYNSVARDLALDIKRNGSKSRFVRPTRGKYALRQQGR